MPIISLYITSYARDLLYESFIKNNEDKIYYFDTDSGITEKEIKVSKELGGIKKEYNIKELILIKPKQYFLRNDKDKEIIRFKGIPHKYISKCDFINIANRLIGTKDKKYNYNRLVKFREGLRRNLKINSEVEIGKMFDLMMIKDYGMAILILMILNKADLLQYKICENE